MNDEWKGFIQKRSNGSEMVNYNDPNFPTYIHKGWVCPSSTWANDPHYHDDIEILTVTSGYMAYSVDGKEILLDEGDTIFVNSNHIHYSVPKRPERTRYTICVFHPEILCSSPTVEKKYIRCITENPKIPFLVFKNSEFLGNKISRDVMALPDNMVNEFMITKQLFTIWESIITRCDSPDSIKKYHYRDSQVTALKEMMAFIQEEYANPITLDEIAEVGNVSRTFCHDLFRKYTDQTPIECLTRYRVSKVAELLKDPSLNMSEIASRTGFSSTSYLGETFRKYYGETPREFRKKSIWKEA